MTLDEEIAGLEEELKKSKMEVKLAKREYHEEFRKARSHVIYEVGGEWFAWYTKTKITPESNFDEIIEEEKNRMRKMYNSLSLCPKCKKGRLINEGKFFECDNLECRAHVKVYEQ